mgnify:CR=1 FL=1
MASGETNNQALYEQLAAACAEQERASVEHCAEQGNVPMCSEQFETAMKRIVLQLNERPQHRQPGSNARMLSKETRRNRR